MEDIAADHVGFAVLHKELKAVRGLLNLLLMHHVPNEALVHILCREGTSNESTQKSKGSFVDERCGDTDPHGHRDRGSQWHRKQLPPHLPFPQPYKSELSPHCSWLHICQTL